MAEKNGNDAVRPGDFTGAWDPDLMRRVVAALRPVNKYWYRAEVRGLERMPRGGSLIVGNHSGGMVPPDIPIFGEAFFEHFGYDQPLYSLVHEVLFKGPQKDLFQRAGLVTANRENAAKVLEAGFPLIVFREVTGMHSDLRHRPMSSTSADAEAMSTLHCGRAFRSFHSYRSALRRASYF